MKILVFSLLFFLSPPVFAKSANVLRNFSLVPSGSHYELALFFDEANPGAVGDNPLANGCAFLVRSQGNFLMTGRYKFDFEEEHGPTMADGRWWKQYTAWAPGFDLRVSCKSDKRMSDEYIRKVMAGYLRVER